MKHFLPTCTSTTAKQMDKILLETTRKTQKENDSEPAVRGKFGRVAKEVCGEEDSRLGLTEEKVGGSGDKELHTEGEQA